MSPVYDRTIDGYAAFNGPFKLAVITTKHHQGLSRNGVTVYEPMPHSSWSIHFTSPAMPIEDLQAIVASLPTEP
jgi:hypothetical protein